MPSFVSKLFFESDTIPIFRPAKVHPESRSSELEYRNQLFENHNAIPYLVAVFKWFA